MLFRMYMRKKAMETGGGNAAPIQYAGAGNAPYSATPVPAPAATPFQTGGLAGGAPEIGSKLMNNAPSATEPVTPPRIPADFDARVAGSAARHAAV